MDHVIIFFPWKDHNIFSIFTTKLYLFPNKSHTSFPLRTKFPRPLSMTLEKPQNEMTNVGHKEAHKWSRQWNYFKELAGMTIIVAS